MKRQIMKSLSTLCVSAMALFAASSLVVSCYDDGALWDAVEDVQNDVKELQTKLEALTSKVDALYTLKFQVTAANELQYSFDGGANWVSTGVDLTEGCDDVSLVDNGDSVTITVGEQSFTIEKPEEIVFEIRAGKVYFESEGEQTIAIKSSGIEDLTVMSVPKGWEAKIDVDGYLVVTAPDYADTEWTYDEDWNDIPPTADWEGVIKIHACSAEGKCMVGKVPVEVSQTPIVVKAFGGKYMVTSTSQWMTIYYGISPKETYKQDAQVILNALETNKYDILDEWKYVATPTAEGEVADVLGSKPEVGKEYVVWAIDEYAASYTLDELVLAYYSPVSVSVVEDEAKRTPYDVVISIDVEGADSYYAYTSPVTDPEYAPTTDELKENMLATVGGYWSPAKLHKEPYTGSVYMVAEGTQGSATGMEAPNQKCYVLVMPVDGRSFDEYTVDDIFVFDFTTGSLVSGGSMDAAAEEVTSYTEYGEEVALNPYSEIGVKVAPASEGKWAYFYYRWLTEEDWTLYGADEEVLVATLSADPWFKNSPKDVEFPYYSVEQVEPATKMHFVAFFVDEAGKYGKVSHLEVASDELVKSEIAVELEAAALVEGVLKNAKTLEVAITTDPAAAEYAYLWLNSGDDYLGSYTGQTDAELAETVFFDENAVKVSAAELTDGKLVLEGHEYNTEYFLAVLPFDAEGNPGNSAASLSYECVFALESVVDAPASFVSEPEVVFSIPEMTNAEYGETGYWYENYYDYSVNYAVTPVKGTEVVAVIVDPASASNYGLDLSEMTSLEKANGLWNKTLSGQAYYTTTFTEAGNSDPRSFFAYDDEALSPVILVSWKDAEGKYYYKEISLEQEFAIMYANLQYEFNDSFVEVTADPTNVQWDFVWADMMNAPAAIDVDVTQDGYLWVVYDMAAVYGEDSLPAELVGKYMAYMGWEYELIPATETCGTIQLASTDHFGEVVTTNVYYKDLTADSCVFTAEMLYLSNQKCTKAATAHEVYVETTGGGAL